MHGQRFHIEALVDGRVTKVATFGIFVELDKDLEGLAHISELNLPAGAKIEEKFKVGDAVTVRVGAEASAALRLGDRGRLGRAPGADELRAELPRHDAQRAEHEGMLAGLAV